MAHDCEQSDQKVNNFLIKFISLDAFDNGDFQATRDDKFEAIYVTRMVSAVSFKLKRFSFSIRK
jgi:hypothetical protein